jgi:uncharacterized protein YjbI with pentapeptide repeats
MERDPLARDLSTDSKSALDGIDLKGANLKGQDLQGIDLSGRDLSGANLAGANLRKARLFRANLRNANLRDADLTMAELTGADLSHANMENVVAENAGFGMSSLEGARLFQARLDHSTLTHANLNGADIKASSIKYARLRGARITNADLTGSTLVGSDLALADVSGSCFNNADLRNSNLRMIKGYEDASWIGVDIRDINFAGAYLMRRFILDQNFIKEFKERNRLNKLIYYLWWLTSDCGRSMLRWCLWTVLLIFIFGFTYMIVGVDYGEHPTWLSPFYYSVVTLTTLGYGDVVPASFWAQIVAMVEVVTGYIMLGGLLSIFTNKMARRAD